MKVAIVHEWFVTYAGSEKVMSAILELYPDADVFSLVDFLDEEERKAILKGKYVNTSFIQSLPFAKKYFRNYLPLFPKAIENFDLSKYDLIVSSSHAVAKGVKKNKNQLHICYCHTPIRYAWDLYEEYTEPLNQPKKFLVQKILKHIKKWDYNSLDRVDFFIANSNYVAKRIKRNYNRDSIVIYPPVETQKFTLKKEKEDFYLVASRLVPYKKIKLIVESFNEIPNKKLIVIGSGEEFESIKNIAKENIELLGYKENKDMISYMQRSKAFVFAAIEDFGITPIEAMSCGTPVIALNEGGTAETVTDNITGIHFNEQTKKSIIEAVEKLEKTNFNHKEISDSMKGYSVKRFKKEIKTFIDSKLNQK